MPLTLEYTDYGTFGTRFVRRAVTVERVSAAVGRLAGKSMRLGPLSLGPAGLVQAAASGVIGTPVVTQRDSADVVTFDVSVPVSLNLRLRVGQETSYHADVTVGLVLLARAAEPPPPATPPLVGGPALLLVIDIQRVRADDIGLTLRGSGLGAAILPFVEVLEREIRAQLALAVNRLVGTTEMRASRVIDVGARVDSAPPVPPPADLVWLSYDAFGERFFRRAVSLARISAAVARVAGREVTFGPLRAGPRDVATVAASGNVGTPTVTPRDDAELVTFDVTIPVDLDLTVSVARDVHYRCALTIPLELTARAADELLIVVDIAPVDAAAVGVDVTSRGLLSRALRSVGDLDAQLRTQVTKAVDAEVADPVSGDRVVDVGALIDE